MEIARGVGAVGYLLFWVATKEMVRAGILVVLLLTSLRVCAQQPGPGALRPLKVNGNWIFQELTASEQALTFEDTIGVRHRIALLENSNKEPECFVSHIETPVCSDTLCNLMDIRMFWTISGNYLGYDTIPGKPLTKNDHLDFTPADYEKLHELLCDEQSILRRRHKDDLFDKESSRVSQVVDAVTGATAKEVKEAVVDGAVYSSYTIYQLVHSQLSAVIRSYVKDSLLSRLDYRLSRSERADERVFFLQNLPPDRFPAFADEIMGAIRIAPPRDRLFILKKMPASLWQNAAIQTDIARMAGGLDIHSLSHFLLQLRNINPVSAECLIELSPHVAVFSQNQLKTYLDLLEKNPVALRDTRVLDALLTTEKDPDYKYSSFLKSFLDNLSSK